MQSHDHDKGLSGRAFACVCPRNNRDPSSGRTQTRFTWPDYPIVVDIYPGSASDMATDSDICLSVTSSEAFDGLG
jgi:hypothetical protein